MKLLRRYIVKLVRILLGLAIMALGIAIAKQAYCLSPWQVLNDGLAHTFFISIGTANIYVGIVILLLDMLIREKFGIGMVLNIVMTGVFTDMYLSLNTTFGIMPKTEAIPLQILFCLVAVFLNALGMYFYMSAWMGAGPRDTLVVFLAKHLPVPLGLCKLGLEAIAFTIGWLIGGEIGVGSVLFVLLGGPTLQWVFQLFHFNVKASKNESILDTWRIITGKMAFSESEKI